ncbi:cytochrome b561 [Tamilnaduibacter salinus]|uniref:Cytochrome b561 n=1 Tax=Tamilnaduibacter salinus TaxID=1484056 RepID=A0A2U1CUC1_9GAMM|nr:cytochrome b [Tamilnaduibacter salinus]PVY70682.1 cytochrome b561 [Tamilnaduibacter salinus]
MPAGNTTERYGWVSAGLHWLIAIVVVGLFWLGWWMVDLSYYDDWYTLAPHIHRSVGILLIAAMILRLLWRWLSPPPPALASHSRFERAAAHMAHGLLYVLIFVAGITGYLISTADGSGIDVFDWFTVPSVTGEVKRMEDWAGSVHYWVTWAIIALAVVHALGAVKHHVVDRDETLRRMLGLRPR